AAVVRVRGGRGGRRARRPRDRRTPRPSAARPGPGPRRCFDRPARSRVSRPPDESPAVWRSLARFGRPSGQGRLDRLRPWPPPRPSESTL
ncbi:MAG: hypothetical protein AVDCRST_MAG59-4681, partial [uncultured Thermomicrobiales bacterium]